jgi:hypothetical protein
LQLRRISKLLRSNKSGDLRRNDLIQIEAAVIKKVAGGRLAHQGRL